MSISTLQLQGSIPDSDGGQNKDGEWTPLLGPHYERVHVVMFCKRCSKMIDPCWQCPCA